MRTLRYLVVSVLVSTLFTPSPAAARERGSITLRGTGSAYVDVVFDNPVEIRFEDDFTKHFEASTNGEFVGFAVQRLPGKKILAGGVWVKRLDLLDGRIPARFSLGSRARLSPGRYRFILLAEENSFSGQKASASVTIPVTGIGGHREYRPTKAADVHSLVGDFRIVAGQPGGVMRLPVEVRRSTTTLVAFAQEADYGQLSYGAVCVIPPGSVCEQADDPLDVNHVFASPGSGRSGLMVSALYGAGDLRAAEYEAHVRMAAAGWSTKLATFVLSNN